ncbi:MAG TPA: signal peptide peptidase SppA [Phnomibacter sp.]|nr:signal peptide peptidase SppA [Phnomibacter sp.]
MRSFLKIFFASLLALVIFFLILLAAGVGLVSSAVSEEKPEIKARTVLVIDLNRPIMEQRVEEGFGLLEGQTPSLNGLYDIERALDAAATDTAVKGVYLIGGNNPNGFATSQELRHSLKQFKNSGKFIVAFANDMNQRAYEVVSISDEIYLNPVGGMSWQGYSYQLAFFKATLDKLEVKPEIFYAGQFKSATEPFRYTKMSDPNREQMTAFVESLYQQFLLNTSKDRGIDTARLRMLATELRMHNASDGVREKLVDDAQYDDEVKSKIARRIGAPGIDKINFMTIGDYIKAYHKPERKKDLIAVIYAQGDIVDGNSTDGMIGGDGFRQLVRKARLDKNVKAVVLRVNSPGGSAVASEVIHRELSLLQKEKPLVVSMGDYAASGGYYISCGADSIFAQPNTLTGSIGVFAMLFDVSKMMSNKLGITFDEVNTAPSATLGSPFRPLTDKERKYLQEDVDSIYATFKARVAVVRQLKPEMVDSIAQGRIWSGTAAVKNGLVDRLGGMQDAVACAARLAKLKEYSLKEWPVVEPFFEKLFGKKKDEQIQMAWHVKQQMGPTFYYLWKQMEQLRQMQGRVQMRLPFFAAPQGL